MGADYYYTRAGQRFGPVSAEQLKSMAASGELQLDDMVWKEGMASSIAAARLKGLFPAAALNPAPPQPAVAAPLHPDEFRVADMPPPKTPPTPIELPRPEPTSRSSDIDDDTQADIMARKAKEAALAAGHDALHAFKILAANPVGGLKAAFESLGATRAMAAGIVFGVVFAFCVLVGGRLLYSSMMSPVRQVQAGMTLQVDTSFPFVGYIKLPLLGAAIIALAVGGSALLRKIFKGRGSIESDVFLAGAAFLPCGVAILLGGILGVLNGEVTMAITVVALAMTILMLYSGFTTLHGIPETAATYGVPLILLLSAYMSKIIMAI